MRRMLTTLLAVGLTACLGCGETKPLADAGASVSSDAGATLSSDASVDAGFGCAATGIPCAGKCCNMSFQKCSNGVCVDQ